MLLDSAPRRLPLVLLGHPSDSIGFFSHLPETALRRSSLGWQDLG